MSESEQFERGTLPPADEPMSKADADYWDSALDAKAKALACLCTLFSYDGNAGRATFYMGDHKIDLTISFLLAQQLAEDLKRRYLDGYRAGLAAARCALERMEDSQI